MATDSQTSATRTQIVVQWLIERLRSATQAELDLQDVWQAEDSLDRASDGLFEVDGHDIGGGSANVFLYASDPEAAVTRIISIFEKGLLRPGMRIGVAQYKNDQRTDWSYRAAYPPELKEFDIV